MFPFVQMETEKKSNLFLCKQNICCNNIKVKINTDLYLFLDLCCYN